MNKSSYFIVGKHPVIEALKNNERKVLKIFLTEEIPSRALVKVAIMNFIYTIFQC